MNIRRREDVGNREVGKAPKNAATKRVDGDTQAKPVKGNVTSPKSVGVTGVRNAVNAPKP